MNEPKEQQAYEIALQRQLAEIKLKEQEIGLRQTYGTGLLAILAIELVVVNVIFWFYGEDGHNWGIPDGVGQIWLAATVVQVVGVITVVTRYLFRRRDAPIEFYVPPALSKPASTDSSTQRG